MRCNPQAASDAVARQWSAAGTFRSFVSWGHDSAPSASDPLRRALDWCALAQQVHSPVALDDVEAELRAMQDMDVRQA
ncbi:hypothetical protein HYH03_018435 [Edaphochlamys debaryana]|uniref:Uncharacterized protein n=1 Tax=Edaphochlamys debaryana TaxID=47281 RepID=A0A836BPE8_9CHLO|nr:hypothetical protein HYH03_018435 [Edaphochlamys debaryana]|eukprot:KAG2482664.1 hypothetical protein HYH03_018435 [Edaphochlamys debaryana]